MSELEPHDPSVYNYAAFPPGSDRGDFARFVEHLRVNIALEWLTADSLYDGRHAALLLSLTRIGVRPPPAG